MAKRLLIATISIAEAAKHGQSFAASEQKPVFSCTGQQCARDGHGRMLLQHLMETTDGALSQVPSPTDASEVIDRTTVLKNLKTWKLGAGAALHLQDAHQSLLSLAQADESVSNALVRAFSAHSGEEDPIQPMGIAKWIKHQMIPQVNSSKVDMQRQVNRAAESVESCASVIGATQEHSLRQAVSLRSREMRLIECNEDANKLKEAKEKACHELQVFSESLEAPMCLDRIFRHATDLLEQNLQSNWEFFNEKYPAFMKHKKACDDATLASETKLTQCQRDKMLIEATFCELRSGRRSACSEYSACYSNMSDSFKKVMQDVKALNQKTKDEYKAIRRIECFIGIMVDGNAESDNMQGNCDWQNLDVSNLNVTYPDLPEKRDCQVEVETKIDYSGVQCPAEVGSQDPEAELDMAGESGETDLAAEDQVPPEGLAQSSAQRIPAAGSARTNRGHKSVVTDRKHE